ncbi:relaxase/mobilization nuclease [Streptomyces sp. NPDC001515]
MIVRFHGRTRLPHDALEAALDRPVASNDGPERTVVAHWPGLDRYTLGCRRADWTSADWAEHLEDACLERAFAVAPEQCERAIVRLSVCLAPTDRELTKPEWAEVAMRLARATGLDVPGDDAHGCRWVAVHAEPGRMELVASLILLDGSWRVLPRDYMQRLSDEARRLERDLRLVPASARTAQDQTRRTVSSASTRLGNTLVLLADEQGGPLATVRRIVEHTAHQLAQQPANPGAAHRLELIGRRIHSIQQDLDGTVAHLTQPPAAPSSAGLRRPNRRTP